MKKHYYWLDVLRALAMLEVLCSHYRNVLFPSWGDVSHSSGGGGGYSFSTPLRNGATVLLSSFLC